MFVLFSSLESRSESESESIPYLLNRVFSLSRKKRQKNRFLDSRFLESAQHYQLDVGSCVVDCVFGFIFKTGLGLACRTGNTLKMAVFRRFLTYSSRFPPARYGGRHTVTMMPGDGIGPEMMGFVKDVFRVAGAPIDFEHLTLDPSTDNYDDLHNVSIQGGAVHVWFPGRKVGFTVYKWIIFFLIQAIQSVKRNGCAIKGNIETKMNRPDIKSRNVEMRNELDLFANVIRSQTGIQTRHKDIDIVCVRQNTEGGEISVEK
jgi:hypothetical protein